MKIKGSYLEIALLAVIALAIASRSSRPGKAADATVPSDLSKTMVTFIELGSVNSIPCCAMQPVMRTLEKSMAVSYESFFMT